MLRRRLDGAPLADLAAGAQVAVSTAHERIGKAVERVRAQVRRHRLRREGLEPILALVGA
jgi:DNA-directed RNA polymerase specialized sigma24 family protein